MHFNMPQLQPLPWFLCSRQGYEDDVPTATSARPTCPSRCARTAQCDEQTVYSEFVAVKVPQQLLVAEIPDLLSERATPDVAEQVLPRIQLPRSLPIDRFSSNRSLRPREPCRSGMHPSLPANARCNPRRSGDRSLRTRPRAVQRPRSRLHTRILARPET